MYDAASLNDLQWYSVKLTTVAYFGTHEKENVSNPDIYTKSPCFARKLMEPYRVSSALMRLFAY